LEEADKFDNVTVKLRIFWFDFYFVLICPVLVDLGHAPEADCSHQHACNTGVHRTPKHLIPKVPTRTPLVFRKAQSHCEQRVYPSLETHAVQANTSSPEHELRKAVVIIIVDVLACGLEFAVGMAVLLAKSLQSSGALEQATSIVIGRTPLCRCQHLPCRHRSCRLSHQTLEVVHCCSPVRLLW